MLFTAQGGISSHFLQFAAASFYYTTGYGVSFLAPDGRIEPYQPPAGLPEPYDGYLVRQLSAIQNYSKMNNAHIHFMDFQEVVILYPISHREKHLGTVIVGPMSVKALNARDEGNRPHFSSAKDLDTSLEQLIRKKMVEDLEGTPNPSPVPGMEHPHDTGTSGSRYMQNLPMVQQFQIQYLTNLLNLVMDSTYYDPTVISTLPISDESRAMPSAQKISGRIVHHSIDQEEKILQQILISDDTFTKLALKHISKLSNLVAPPLANDPVRSEKNRFIVSATIVSRAAIKFGMSSDVAFSYSDYFINEIETCQSLQEVWDLQMALFLFYREEVKKSRDRTYFNTPTSMLLSYVENHIDTNLSLQEICRELSLDYKYASNCFKKDTGLGFNKYLTAQKMEVAKKELETTETPIQTISENLGFNNAYYFTRTFKHTFGLSPTEYRKRSMRE